MIGRRGFLGGGAALGCSLAASPLITPVAFASAPFDQRLVVLILRGGMDGIDALRPLGDPAYAGLRPTLNDGTHLDLGGFWGLHAALEPLMPLWDAGEFGAVQAVSTPYRDKRSHFDGQDILEAGTVSLETDGGGWLNRLLGTIPGSEAETAYAIGREQMAILAGDAPAMRWSPEAQLDISPQAKRLLDLVHHNDPLFRDASAQAITIAEQLVLDAAAPEDDDMAMAEAMMAEIDARGAHVELARFAADRLRGETRIASFSIAAWDTHQNQRVALRRALEDLAETILTLRAGLGPVWDKTAILCMTEFGRTAFENGTRGTDHGTGGAMFFAGGAVRGGQVLGDWPGLGEAELYNRRDLMPTGDIRAAAGWVLRGLFGTDADVIERVVFPGTELGRDPGIIL